MKGLRRVSPISCVIILLLLASAIVGCAGFSESPPKELPTLVTTAMPIQESMPDTETDQSRTDQDLKDMYSYTITAPEILQLHVMNSANIVAGINILKEDLSMVFNQKWRDVMEETLSIEEEILAGIHELKPSPEMESVHSDMLSFSNEYSTAVSYIRKYLDTYDLAHLETATEHILAGNEHMERVGPQLEELKEEISP